MARALGAVEGGIEWLELDTYEPAALRQIRDAAPMPIASLETLFGRKQYKPFFEAGAVDVAIVDCIYNGFWESMKIAALADMYEVNCAAHNYHGNLGTAISVRHCTVRFTISCAHVMTHLLPVTTWLEKHRTMPGSLLCRHPQLPSLRGGRRRCAVEGRDLCQFTSDFGRSTAAPIWAGLGCDCR
eukprot:SAG11_NODE_1373_length_5095_cov_3.854484_3_plen_185_part_00